MNILTETIAHLGEVLDLPVRTEVPAERPEAFVTVERSGGSTTRVDDRATLTVQVWCRDRLRAESLMESARDALLTMPDAVEGVHRMDVSTSYYPEQGSQTWPRYVLTCLAYCRR